MNKHIDDIVKNALENLEVPYNPLSWEDMQSRMESSDTEVDDAIRAELNNVRVAYQHKHWLQLKDWLDYTWYASNKIFVSKTAEAILMILALITFYNYSSQPIPTVANQPVAIVENWTQSKNETNHAINKVKTEESSVYVTSQTQLNSASIKDASSLSNSYSNVLPHEKVSENSPSRSSHASNPSTTKSRVTAASVSSTAEAFRHVNAPVNDDDASTGTIDTSVPGKRLEIASKDIQINEVIINDTKTSTNNHLTEDKRTVSDKSFPGNISNVGQRHDVQHFAKVTIPSAKLVTYDEADLQAQHRVLANQISNAKKWSISAFTDINLNHITTPYDDLIEQSGYNTNRTGLGGGFLVHRDLGPIELSSGFMYSSKQYPQNFIELFIKHPTLAATKFTLKGIELNVATLPLHATYYINQGKWQTYVVGGGALHVALQADYNIEIETIAVEEVNDEQLEVENAAGIVTRGTPPVHEKKRFTDGILAGGPFNENFYFTLDLGFGVERKLSPSTSLFIQPTVYYNLFNRGLSANDNIINTFSAQLGVKTRL